MAPHRPRFDEFARRAGDARFVGGSNGQFKLVGDQFTKEPYGIGISKGDVAFCEFIDDTLTKAGESGAYADAWDSTAGKVAGPAPALPKFDPCS